MNGSWAGNRIGNRIADARWIAKWNQPDAALVNAQSRPAKPGGTSSQLAIPTQRIYRIVNKRGEIRDPRSLFEPVDRFDSDIGEHLNAYKPALKLIILRSRRANLSTIPTRSLPLQPPRMSGFDANRVYNIAVHDLPSATTPDSKSETERLLLEFLQSFRVGGEFIYRCD